MRTENCPSVMALPRSSSSSLLFPPSSVSSSTTSLNNVESGHNNNSNNNEKFIPALHAKLRKLILRSVSANITEVDPVVKGIYLGNVVTTWGKGHGCLERPATALWKNHCEGRASIRMTVMVTPSGLKVETNEHGLTEYWNNRLTWCGIPNDVPKLFCWIYRHEGRKLKQELRCHAVLCNSKDDARTLMETLRTRLAEALYDFRKEKLQKQNARLSSFYNIIYNTTYGTSPASQTAAAGNSTSGSNNYKKEKASPSKLTMIEESEEEEHFLLPELTSYDKVMHHLLQLELKRNNAKYYSSALHSRHAGQLSPRNYQITTNERVHMSYHKPSSVDSSDCGTKSSADEEDQSISPVSLSPPSSISGGMHNKDDDESLKSSRSNSTESEDEIFCVTGMGKSTLSPTTIIHHQLTQQFRNSNNHSNRYEQIICSV